MIVKVRSTSGNAATEYSSDASTWGQLLDELRSKDVDLSGKKIMATSAEGNVIDYTDEVSGPSVALPTTDILSVMLVTTKVKSGNK